MAMVDRRYAFALWLLTSVTAWAQVTPVATTADTQVTPYTGLFAYGSNMGYFGWSDNDNQLGDILLGNPAQNQPGAGVHTIRGALYDDFIQTYGVTIRVPQFTRYRSLGAIDNTIFVNASYHVSGARRDPNHYDGCADQSWMHANMYLPIWIDDMAHPGFKKVNPQNYLADYLYQVASTYKGLIKFYEVWNEPDFTPNYNASQNAASPQYWGAVNPVPCDLSNLKAPISHVNRLHRIIYEVVKTADPSAYVATGGLGYPAFLQAMLRNTDNPGTTHEQHAGEGDGTEGSVSSRYPLKGGAYFDVLSYHSYPQYGMRRYSGNAAACTANEVYVASTGFCVLANSDAAVAGYLDQKQQFDTVLAAAGYDGTTKPRKVFIVTENNVPRVMPRYVNAAHTGLDPPSDQYGAEDYARNYVIKALIGSQKNGIRQYHLYGSSDEVQENGTDCSGNWVGTDNTKVEGLFHDLGCIVPYNQQPTVQYWAYKTTSALLYGYRYDAAKTQALALPASADGAAFSDQAGHVVYALWAKAVQHANENPAAVVVGLPGVSGTLQRRAWDFSQTTATTTAPANAISLGGAPIFLAKAFTAAINDVIFRHDFEIAAP